MCWALLLCVGRAGSWCVLTSISVTDPTQDCLPVRHCHTNTHARTHKTLPTYTQGPQLTVVQAAPNSSLPPDSFPDPETSADAAPVNAAATGGVPLTGFTGQQHLCFQWGACVHARRAQACACV